MSKQNETVNSEIKTDTRKAEKLLKMRKARNEKWLKANKDFVSDDYLTKTYYPTLEEANRNNRDEDSCNRALAQKEEFKRRCQDVELDKLQRQRHSIDHSSKGGHKPTKSEFKPNYSRQLSKAKNGKGVVYNGGRVYPGHEPLRVGDVIHINMFNSDNVRIKKYSVKVTNITQTGLVRTDKGQTFKYEPCQHKLSLYDKVMKEDDATFKFKIVGK